VFGVTMKITLLVSFALNTAYQITLPDLAEAFRRRTGGQLGRTIAVANLVALATALSAFAAALAGGGWLLAAFGEEFEAGHAFLVALLVGQILVAAGGPSVQLLTLGNRQGGALRASFVAAGFLFVLDGLLIPPFGIWGAVIAVLFVNALWAGWIAGLAYAATGIRVDAGGLLRHLAHRRVAPAGE
jgi:O-antigen/teichoic acid export membrane protein